MLLLKRWLPARILVIERQERFTARSARRPGNFLAVSASRTGFVADHLACEQLPKHGLRQLFNDDAKACSAEMSRLAVAIRRRHGASSSIAKLDERVLADAHVAGW
ncbi:MAG: hypothetical protein U1F68_11780 [Gammaproteobacteria bacterium]